MAKTSFAEDMKRHQLSWALANGVTPDMLETRRGQLSWVLKKEHRERNLFSRDGPQVDNSPQVLPVASTCLETLDNIPSHTASSDKNTNLPSQVCFARISREPVLARDNKGIVIPR